MKIPYRILIGICGALFVFFNPISVHAAKLILVPSGNTLNIGSEFTVDIKIDSEEAGINAAQATLTYPTGNLKAIRAEKTNSAFNFWLEEPVISENAGTVAFTGGTSKGISGSAIQALRITFRAVGAGSASIGLSDATVTASDGKGTNVLSEIKNVTVGVGTKVVSSEAPAGAQPERVVREAVKAEGAPVKPVIRVPLYPDETKWYNRIGDTVAFWDLTPDVVQVATRLSKSRDAQAGEKESELFTGKNFGPLDEGIWYVRVQFRNNVGWGELAYYKISIDTTAPLPFEIGIDNPTSENPSPKITFDTSDSLSGIAEYQVFIDGRGPTVTTSSAMILSPQAPGKHTLVIRAVDAAGNRIEDDLEFEILPLPTPTIDFLTKSVSQEEIIFASGRSMPGVFLDVRILDEKNQEVLTGTAEADGSGHWEISMNSPLALGDYRIVVRARDAREATSYPTEAMVVHVRPATVLRLGFLELGWFEIILLVTLLILAFTGFLGWRFYAAKETRGAYRAIAARDVEKIGLLLEQELDAFEKSFHGMKKIDPKVKPETEAHLHNLREVVGKMKKYLVKELEKLN